MQISNYFLPLLSNILPNYEDIVWRYYVNVYLQDLLRLASTVTIL